MILQAWSVGFEAGAYFVSGSTPLEDVHLALGTGYGFANGTRFEARFHTLFVSPGAETPRYLEPATARRSYFGVELGVAWPVGGQHMRATVWKPFGYDSADATNTGLSLGLAAELRI